MSRSDNSRRRFLPSMDSWAILLILLSGAAGLFLLFQTCIYHDALWTYGYMRSVLLDQDLSFFNEFMLSNSYFMYVPHPHEPVFYCGAGLLMAPFFLAGHLIAQIGSQWAGVFADGYSWPYTLSTSMAGVACGLTALVLIYRLCRRFFDVGSALIGVMLMFWAGNMCFYTFTWPLYSHAFSVLLVTIYIFCWINGERNNTLAAWALAGGVLGFACWIRPQNILFASLPLYSMIVMLRGRRVTFRQAFTCGSVFGVMWLTGFSPQMVLWWKTAGQPVVDAYAHIGDDFFWLRPRFDYLLFSTNRGLFVWTPVFLLAVPGFFALVRRCSHVAWGLLIAFLLQAYLVACYEFPEGGAGYGSRYMINCMPFIALCLVAAIQAVCWRWRAVLVMVGLVLVYANTGLIMAYQLEMMPHNKHTPAASELINLAFVCGPSAMKSFIFSTHINENVFARTIMHSLDQQRMSEALRWGGVYVGCCILVAVCSVIAIGGVSYVRRHLRGVVASGVCVFLLVDVFLLRLDSGPAYENIWPALTVAYDRQEAPPALAGREFILSPMHSEQMICIDHGKPVDVIDVTSVLVCGHNIPEGTQLVSMQVVDDAGAVYEYRLSNGQDTAEYGVFRTDWSGKVTQPKNVVHHWLSRDEECYYYGNGYHTRYLLPRAVVLRRIVFRYVASQGEVIVNGLVLSQRSGKDEQ